ncbi:MAG: RDD family protein [Motiliproteus sp.]
MNQPQSATTLAPASLPKRLAAMFYDSLMIGALWLFVSLIAVALNGGELVQGPLFRSTLFLVTFLYFAIFWAWKGQTVGMVAWRLRIQTNDGRLISGMQALLRFFCAGASLLCLGAGFWWMLFNNKHQTWHDRYSDSCMVQLPPRIKKV